MSLQRWMGFGLLLASFPAAAQTMTAEGIVQSDDADQCNQNASYSITDPCTGFHQVYTTSGLGAHLCENVVVEGWDVGVECVILQLSSVTPVAPACLPGVRAIRVHEQIFTWLDWLPVPCGDRYDVIRGDLGALAEAGGTVDLGTVRCLRNDTPYASSFSDRDSAMPESGQGFFYLVRAYGPSIGQTSYGASSSGAERIPSSGECPSLP